MGNTPLQKGSKRDLCPVFQLSNIVFFFGLAKIPGNLFLFYIYIRPFLPIKDGDSKVGNSDAKVDSYDAKVGSYGAKVGSYSLQKQT